MFRTALTALTEPRTLWRRITCFPSPRRCAALRRISTMYSSHWKPSGEEGIPTGLQSTWEHQRDAWEHWQQAWEHLESQSCIQFIFSSIYLCNYIATHLHTLYLDWLQAVLDDQFEVCLKMTIEWTQRYTPRTWSSDFGYSVGGGNWADLEIHLEAVIDWY